MKDITDSSLVTDVVSQKPGGVETRPRKEGKRGQDE